MVQGKLKMGKSHQKKKSIGSQKRKQINAKKNSSKGWKTHAAKGRKAPSVKADKEITKAINKKNEAITASRAIGAGNKFFLNDIRERGCQELEKQNKERMKKEQEKCKTKLSDRLKDQLRKLGKDA